MTSPIPETAASDLPAGAAPGSADPAAELRRLAALLDVSQALSGTLDLRTSLDRVLEILRRSHGVLRAAVTLLDPDSGHLYVAASSGLDPAGQRARYRLGEGITGRVVASGRPVVVPQVSREPLFLHRTADRSRQETTFICVPISVNRQPAGALAVDLAFEPARDYDQAAKFIGVVGTQLAQAVKIQRLVEAERQRLAEENAHLREELRERYDFANLVGSSGPMRAVLQQIAQVAGASTTVLIRGESGTGKASGTGFRRSLAASVAALERDLISDALKSARGNRARAARLLDTTERIIGYKIRKLGIDAGRFRS
ncbi:MAG: GAF domain-containing protein [Gemmatimonadota bacterium]